MASFVRCWARSPVTVLRPLPLLWTNSHAPVVVVSALAPVQRCTFTNNAKKSLGKSLPRDAEIRATHVQLASDSGLSTPMVTRQVLASLHEGQSLRVVAQPANADPICRIVDVAAEEARAQAMVERARQRERLSRVKELELNWAIDMHDLGYKLRNMQGFLDKGFRVEVLLANKKRGGKRASPAEALSLVQQLRAALESAEGVEWKEAEGRVGSTMRLFLEKPKARVLRS